MPNPMNLPKHACGLYLTHNEHRNYYESAVEWVGNRDAQFKNEESKERAIATDSVWVLQWYPDTPVGFHMIAAPTLEEVLAWAAEIEKEEANPLVPLAP